MGRLKVFLEVFLLVPRHRRIVLLVLLVINVLSWGFLAVIHFRPQWVVSLPPEDEECRDAPAYAPYHDGMTLCPGQLTRVPVLIEPEDQVQAKPKEDRPKPI